MSGVLPERWFARTAVEVAPELLGCELRHDGVALRITEVEAYMGEADPGSHAYRGPNKRNQAMYGPPGRMYVYWHMGLHHCVNLVCAPEGVAQGVLIRAGEVIEGADIAMARRNAAGVCRREVDLARGPARLTVALALGLRDNHLPVCRPGGRATLSGPGSVHRIRAGPRVGVGGEGADVERFPWRYWIADDPTVSVYKAAPPPKRAP
ncbi:MAG: DNA-3-methyladenine glycosylase [Actinomycetota bacterium]|nr:DNA-3-methyladenine glycosylase [Actinomycetota bacterium]